VLVSHFHDLLAIAELRPRDPPGFAAQPMYPLHRN